LPVSLVTVQPSTHPPRRKQPGTEDAISQTGQPSLPVKLEKELSRHGIPLYATDKPAQAASVNATTVLVSRVRQGMAEWFRLQLKEKTWKGLVEHSIDG